MAINNGTFITISIIKRRPRGYITFIIDINVSNEVRRLTDQATPEIVELLRITEGGLRMNGSYK